MISLRDGANGYEILMLRRNLNSDFVGGAYVFPGGGVDDADGDPSSRRLAFGLTDDAASRRLGLERGGLAYYVACLRELFEEAGLLIACHDDGARVAFDDEALIDRLATSRRALNAGTLEFTTMMEREGLRLDLRGLEYLAHWVTPAGMPRRYDTRFFVALAPAGQVAAHDAGETVDDRWIRPIDALDAHARGEFEIILPTIRNLQAIAHFETATQVLAHARSLENIQEVKPRIVTHEGELRILIQGDDGYDD